MPNPKRRHTRSRRDSRRSQNWKLDKIQLVPCPNPSCGKLRQPHLVCPHCGFYNGRLAVALKEKKDKGQGGEESSGAESSS